MKTAVIYARYSSHNQREVSIDDQVRVCEQYCEREGLDVVRVYSDAAMTGTTDARPDFQAMISNAPESDYVVVYQMDRFSRNQYDAPLYKRALVMKGVKLVSATELIPDTPEGVFLEKLLEGQAAYYSMNLARSVRRGMDSNAEKCLCNGMTPFGYRPDENRRFAIDPIEAPIVREIFQRHAKGESIRAIADDLADRGIKTRKGHPASRRFVEQILRNERYTGVYKWGDVRIEGGVPEIISPELFRDAQEVISRRMRDDQEFTSYRLTGRLYCGICGQPMHGECGRGRSKKYFYYCCQRGKNCSGRNIRKDKLEDALCQAVLSVVRDPRTAEEIANAFVAQYGGGDTAAALKANAQKLRENKKATKAIGDAIEKGIELPDVRERLARLKGERTALEAERGKLEAEEKGIDAETVKEFLTQGVKALTCDDILDGFINRVYLFEDKAVATLNFKGEANDLAEVCFALDDLDRSSVRFEYVPNGGPNVLLPETHSSASARHITPPKVLLLHNAIGFVVPLAA